MFFFQYLDSDKTAPSPRRQSFKLPLSTKSPSQAVPNNRGILKRVNPRASDQNGKNVSFNKSVEVMKYNPIVISSSSSESEESCENHDSICDKVSDFLIPDNKVTHVLIT
jgi:hypothetical protein